MHWLSQMLMREIKPATYTPTINKPAELNEYNVLKKQQLIETLKPHLTGRWLSIKELMQATGRKNESGMSESVQKMVDRGLAVRRCRRKTGSAGREVIEYTWL